MQPSHCLGGICGKCHWHYLTLFYLAILCTSFLSSRATFTNRIQGVGPGRHFYSANPDAPLAFLPLIGPENRIQGVGPCRHFSQPIRTIRWLFPYWIQAGSKAAFLIFLDQSGFTWFLDPYLREGWAFRNQSCLSSCSMEHYLLWRILMPRLLYYSLIKKLLHANSSCLFISSPWVP